jgi:predicted amidohydrolase YtcJ
VAGQTTLLSNARILTLDLTRPEATALLATDGRIEAVGSDSEIEALARGRTANERLDAGGRVVIPAFVDPHVHLLASAARRISVDCSPSAVRSIEEIVATVRAAAARTPAGAWVRAAGYDELALRERRHPTRHDLDRAAPGNPVRLLHRTGHACVLNSRALALVGIDASSEEPPGSLIERDLTDGAPNGLLLELNDRVDRVVPPLDAALLAAAVADLSNDLLAAGVTYVEDATPTNGPAEWRLLADLVAAGKLRQGVMAMVGLDHVEAAAVAGDQAVLPLGAVKVVPRELEGELAPAPAELARLIARVDAAGRQVAVHAVGRAAVDATSAAFAGLGAAAIHGRRHRIEHAGLVSEAAATLLGRLGATVVSQPGFLLWNGDSYRERVAPADLPDLYPFRRLLDAGVALAASSDSPVVPADPLRSIGAAVQRRSLSGQTICPEQRIDALTAIALHTRAAAEAAGVAGERGTLAPGKAADFLVLSEDPLGVAVDWDRIAVDLTVQAGRVVYRRERV